MSNLEKYNNVFKNILLVKDEELQNLKYQSIPAWDSVGHMRLIPAIEEAFDIMMDVGDNIEFSSYEKGKELLSEKYDVKF